MSPMDVKFHWMFVVKTVLLFCVIFPESNICQSCDTHQNTEQNTAEKKILLVSTKALHGFPSDALISNNSKIKVCFGVENGQTHRACCEDGFNCDVKANDQTNSTVVILKEKTLQMEDIVIITDLDHNSQCPNETEFIREGVLLRIHNCLKTGKKNLRLFYDSLCSANSDTEDCKESGYKVSIWSNETKCVLCNPLEVEPDLTISLPPQESGSDGTVTPQTAAHIMANLSAVVEKMGSSNMATITSGNITGIITKLQNHSKSHSNINYGITSSGVMKFLQQSTSLANGFSRLVHIPAEAAAMAAKRNGSFAGLLLFPRMYQDDPRSFFLSDEVLGIDMGAEISNLSKTIDIHFNKVDKKGKVASCRSWDGKGQTQNWITDGCHTAEVNGTIICHCSHLTFFAILMSPAPGNISTSDLKSLTYITSIGCGLSMFFLALAFFMYFLIRKGRASRATQLLMNLFGAMLSLNLSFLVNESIAKLGNYSACVALAAFMHYTMLATFSWFFIQALHLQLSLSQRPAEIKNYMIKICFSGWAIPAIVVITLLAWKKYDFIVITTDDGNSETMCWIPDALVHQGVNIGYYAVVFLFSFGVFIITVRHIIMLKPTANKDKKSSSIKTNIFSILGLFLLLGITWAFAFFSHGPLLIPSYYIFTILNSFQGFFLFIYYYNSRKTVGDDKNVTDSSSRTVASHTDTS